MWMSIGLSATLLINVPFFGNVDLKRMFRRVTHSAPADTLPPAWKHASRLALENQMVTGDLPDLSPSPTGLRLTADPRILHVSVDADSGTMAVSPEFGEVTLGSSMQQPLTAYSGQLTERNFHRLWAQTSRTSINSLGVNTPVTTEHTGFSFGFPSPLPGKLKGLLGPGGPQINVYGSENIRISGTSNWTNQEILGQRRSLFPTLDMQQDLNIRLEGQLSDRIRVNLLQNSANQIPLSNRIAVNYRGDEDALFQQVDLGNTNLSLPGTQYVSYSGKNEGLFGAKAESRFGPLDLTILASKQEGRSERASYGGGASAQSQTIRDLEYLKGVYFFLFDPNLQFDPSIGPFDIPENSIQVYRDDANATDDITVTRGWAMPDPSKFAIARTSDSTQLGNGPVAVRGFFDLLTRGADKDYEIMTDVYGPQFPIIRLTQPISGTQRLAVIYKRTRNGVTQDVGGFVTNDTDGHLGSADTTTAVVMQLMRVPPELIGPLSNSLDAPFDTSAALFPVHDLELRNIYQLAGQNIDATSFTLAVRKGRDEPPITTALINGSPIPYLEITGLDNLDETQGTPAAGHDNQVDVSILPHQTGALVGQYRNFIDFANGTLMFLEPRPFAPRLGINGKPLKPFEQRIAALLNRRAALDSFPNTPTESNDPIYDRYQLQLDTDARYYLELQFKAGRAAGEITLGRGNILEGSEVVTVNGQTWHRGTDYDVDYDLGRITLKRQLGPADQLNVDYSYAPLFQQAGRTLLGSAFRLEGRERSLGGAFLYESRGAENLRPRIGEEPSRSLIGDLNGEWGFHPSWMTRMVDILPGIRTTAPSELHVQAEVGASFPNPNTRNEVYIDDMEGVRDAVSLTLDPLRWRWSSVPNKADRLDPDGVARQQSPVTSVPKYSNAELHWFSPSGGVVQEEDLKPTLPKEQGGQATRTVMGLSVPRRPLTAADDDSLWAGLTYVLDPQGLDVSRSQFIELWVDDFNDHHDPGTPSPRVRGQHVKLHIDLGKVSEDQMRAPDVPPDLQLNTEDKLPRDGQLDVTDKNNEDTGLDGMTDEEEKTAIPVRDTVVNGRPISLYRDLVTSNAADPQGDDFKAPDLPNDSASPEALDARRYVGSNGTESDKNVFPYPETEDVIPNGNLDKDESYFEYTIDLGDDSSPYLVTDVQALHDKGEPGYGAVPIDNGWRRYRIPINDAARVQFGATPNLVSAQHVRMWLGNMRLPDMPAESTLVKGKQVERPLVLVGGFDIVGSRWKALALDSSEVQLGSTQTLNALNSIDNADIYVPPFDPGTALNGNQSVARREQTMALEFTKLHDGHSIQAFKTFSLAEDYSRYGKLNWYITGFDIRDSLNANTNDGLYYFVRFSSDENELSYYEYQDLVPIGVGGGINWHQVKLDLTELSNIKLLPRYNPDTLIAVQRSPGSTDSLKVKGRPSFTRLRRISFGLVDRRGTGYYESGQLWFDELRAIDIAKDQGRAQRVAVNGRLSNLFSYNFTWDGRNADFLSVGEARGSGTSTNSLAFSGGLDLHRFFEGTGIVLPVQFNYSQNSSRPRFSAGDDIVRGGTDLVRSETFADFRSVNIAYSRAWSERSNAFLRYTLGGITASYGMNNTHGRSPSSLERTQTTSGAVNYGSALRSLMAIPLPLVRSKLYPMPERIYANYRFDTRSSDIADRVVGTDLILPRNSVGGRSGAISMGSDVRPFDFFHNHLEAQRNLSLPWRPTGGINVGRNVSWAQTNDANYTPRFFPFVKPQLSWNSRYNQINGPELSPDLSVRSISNGQSGTMRLEMPFGSLKPSRADSSSNPFAVVRNLVSRLGNVQGDFTVGKSSAYSRLTGVPDFAYLFGLTDKPGLDDPNDPNDKPRMGVATGNQSVTSLDWRTSARATIMLIWNMQMITLGDYASHTTNSNGAERGTDQLNFPNITVEFGDMPSRLRLDRILRNPRLRSSFNQSLTTDYDNGRTDKSSVSRSFQFRPLLELTGDLHNGLHVEMSTEHRHTERELFRFGGSLQEDVNTDMDLSLSRSFSQGQRVTFFGRETTVKSSVSVGLTGRYERQTGRILQQGEDRNPTNRDRLSLNANGTYGFSANVSGNATLGFSQDRDNQREIVHRSIRVEMSARFTF